MDFADVVRRRRMVRTYLPTDVAPDAVDRIVDAGRSAPSAGFAQGQRFVIVHASQMRTAIAERAGEERFVARGRDPWLSGAPVLVVLCADIAAYEDRYTEADKAASAARAHDGAWPVPWWWVDAGASLMAILLAAIDEGIDAGFLGAHAFEGLADLLGLPPHVEPVGVITLGHARDRTVVGSAARPRLPREEVVRYDRWADS